LWGIIGLNCEKARNGGSGFFGVCELGLLHKVRQTASDQPLGIIGIMLTR